MIDLVPTTFLYFAYGSNMLTRRLQRRAPSARPVGSGFVERRRLTFDKVGSDGSGKCDIVATEDHADRVYGVLFKVPSGEETAIDQAEGLGHGYRKENVRVVTADGEVLALTYIATQNEPGCLPYHWYKAYVVNGAIEHGLPGTYVEQLRNILSKSDPDRDRCAKHEN
jgi:cation transport regulator ChaC